MSQSELRSTKARKKGGFGMNLPNLGKNRTLSLSAKDLAKDKQVSQKATIEELKRQKYQTLKHNLKDLEQQLERKEQELKESISPREYQQAQGELNKREVEIMQLTEQNEDLKQELKHLDDEQNKKIQKLEEKHKKDIESLDEANSIKLAESEEKHKEIVKLKSELESVADLLRDENFEKEQAEKQLEEIRERVKKQEKTLDKKLKQALKEAKDMSRQELEYYEQMLESKSLDFVKLKKQFKQLGSDREKSNLEYENLLNQEKENREKLQAGYEEKIAINQKQFEIQKEELRNRTIRESSKNARELIAKKQEEALDRENRLKNDILKANQRFDRLAEETEKRMANLDKFLEHEISSSEQAEEIEGQWKQYREMMESHVEDLHRQLSALQKKSRGSVVMDNSELASIERNTTTKPDEENNEDKEEIETTVSQWRSLKRMMSNLGKDISKERITSEEQRAKEFERNDNNVALIKLEKENKRLLLQIEKFQYEKNKKKEQYDRKIHNFQMSREEDYEAWKREKEYYAVKNLKQRQEIQNYKKIVSERDVSVRELSQSRQKQHADYTKILSESEKYAQEKKRLQDECIARRRAMVELESQIVNSSHLQESNLKLEEMLKEMQEENERMRQQQQTARIQNDLAQARKKSHSMDANAKEESATVQQLKADIKDLKKKNRKLAKAAKKLQQRELERQNQTNDEDDLP